MSSRPSSNTRPPNFAKNVLELLPLKVGTSTIDDGLRAFFSLSSPDHHLYRVAPGANPSDLSAKVIRFEVLVYPSFSGGFKVSRSQTFNG